MKRKYDRSAILKRAHQLKHQHPWGESLRLAWAEAKSVGAVALAPQRLPLEALVVDTWSLARKIANGRIRAGVRVKIDFGLQVEPEGESAFTYGKSLEKAAVVAYSKQKKNKPLQLS